MREKTPLPFDVRLSITSLRKLPFFLAVNTDYVLSQNPLFSSFQTKIDNLCLYFTLDPGATDESDFDAFSSVHVNQAIPFAQLSNITGERKANLKILLPHELRRQRRLEKEGLYFKRMTEQIRRQKLEECTIERVHQPSKEAFVERYMKHGKPAILTGMMDSWESTKSWKFEELGTKRNPPFLLGP